MIVPDVDQPTRAQVLREDPKGDTDIAVGAERATGAHQHRHRPRWRVHQGPRRAAGSGPGRVLPGLPVSAPLSLCVSLDVLYSLPPFPFRRAQPLCTRLPILAGKHVFTPSCQRCNAVLMSPVCSCGRALLCSSQHGVKRACRCHAMVPPCFPLLPQLRCPRMRCRSKCSVSTR